MSFYDRDSNLYCGCVIPCRIVKYDRVISQAHMSDLYLQNLALQRRGETSIRFNESEQIQNWALLNILSTSYTDAIDDISIRFIEYMNREYFTIPSLVSIIEDTISYAAENQINMTPELNATLEVVAMWADNMASYPPGYFPHIFTNDVFKVEETGKLSAILATSIILSDDLRTHLWSLDRDLTARIGLLVNMINAYLDNNHNFTSGDETFDNNIDEIFHRVEKYSPSKRGNTTDILNLVDDLKNRVTPLALGQYRMDYSGYLAQDNLR